jgi:hypothetical protein
MPAKHAFVNPHEDSPDDTITRPSDWNDDHVINLAIVRTSEDYTLTSNNEMLIVDASGGDKTVTFPDAATLVLEDAALGGKIFDVAKSVDDDTCNKVRMVSATNDKFNGEDDAEINFKGNSLTWYTDGEDWFLR